MPEHRFLSWNTIPIRQVMFDEADVARNPYLAATAVHNLADPSDAGEVFPKSRGPQTFNRESTNHYNALCRTDDFSRRRPDGIYRRGIRRRIAVGPGASSQAWCQRVRLLFRGTRARRREFLAGADSWFHPVICLYRPGRSIVRCRFLSPLGRASTVRYRAVAR